MSELKETVVLDARFTFRNVSEEMARDILEHHLSVCPGHAESIIEFGVLDDEDRAPSPAVDVLVEAAKRVLGDHAERRRLYSDWESQEARLFVMAELQAALDAVEAERGKR